MKNSKYYAIGGGVLAVLALVYFLYRGNEVPSGETKNTTSTATKATTTASVKPTTSTPVAKPKTTTTTKTPVASKSASTQYLDALNIYKKSGYYIQFFPCQATPGTLSVKKGTKVMLDNRDSKAHAIAVGATKYNLAAYGFAIAPFNTVGTTYVTCDGGGSATVTVQP